MPIIKKNLFNMATNMRGIAILFTLLYSIKLFDTMTTIVCVELQFAIFRKIAEPILLLIVGHSIFFVTLNQSFPAYNNFSPSIRAWMFNNRLG